jgi:hypothetical protein
MMFDHHSDGMKRPARKDAEHASQEREVPFGPRAEIADAVHAWLDGVTTEDEVVRAEWTRDVDFWKRVDDDLEPRRRLKTPAGLSTRIMNAIPQRIPVMLTPWWRRELVVTPATALLALLATAIASAFLTAAALR